MFNNCPTFKPISGKIKKLAIFFHGIGGNGSDALDLVQQFGLSEILPDTCIMAPNGIESYNNQPSRYQWFDIANFVLPKIQQQLAQNTRIVQQAIDNQLKTLNLTSQDLILIGFSQGTILALSLVLEAKSSFNSVIGFSGTLVPPLNFNTNIVSTPICLIHGENDQIIDISLMHNAVEFLNNCNLSVKTHIIPNLQHTIDYQGITYAQDFIKQYNKI